MRHLITVIIIVIFGLIYWAGYVAGALGWWILFFGILVLYPLVYKLIDA